MGCNCKWTEIIIAVVVFVMVVWPGLLGVASKWIAAIAAVVLFVHALKCKGVCGTSSVPAKTTSRRRKKRK